MSIATAAKRQLDETELRIALVKRKLELWFYKMLLELAPAGSLAVFIGIHWVVDRMMVFVVPKTLAGPLEIARSLVGVAFLIVYAFLAYDLVRAFLVLHAHREERSGNRKR